MPRLPLDTCVSDSQGGMGYMIQRVACELFRREGIDRSAATVDHAGVGQRGRSRYGPSQQTDRVVLQRPRDGADSAATGRTGSSAEVEPGRWRRVVASPHPLRILEEDAIACLLHAGVVVVACGGGGIPVAWEGDRLVGVEGVVDKDLASSLLARDLHAHKLIIVTSVDRVAIRFGRPDQQWLDTHHGARRLAGIWPRASSRPARWAPRSRRESSSSNTAGEECIITSHGTGGARHPRRSRHPYRGVMILTNARILTFDAANRVLDSGSVEILERRRDRRQCGSGRSRGRACGRSSRPPAHAGADQLPHPPVQHAGPRHAACPARRPPISRTS